MSRTTAAPSTDSRRLVSARTPFSTDPDDELPVGVQLSWRLRALIVSGRLGAGARLPSVRALAEWAGVNVNTVRAAYARLEEHGLVVTRQGTGTFVAERADRSPDVERIAAEAIAEARARGLDPRDVAAVAHVCASVPELLDEGFIGPDAGRMGALPELPDRLERPGAPELPAVGDERHQRAGRRDLRRQIARLEGELAMYEPQIDPEGARFPPEPRVAGVEELERARDALIDRLAELRAAADRRALREQEAQRRRDEMLRDPAAHRWEAVSSQEAGERGCRTWQVEPRYGPLGVLMRWWQVKVSGGCPLAAPHEAARGKRAGGFEVGEQMHRGSR